MDRHVPAQGQSGKVILEGDAAATDERKIQLGHGRWMSRPRPARGSATDVRKVRRE
jgi:hypothetical protein